MTHDARGRGFGSAFTTRVVQNTHGAEVARAFLRDLTVVPAAA
jgi:hypothetical protein